MFIYVLPMHAIYGTHLIFVYLIVRIIFSENCTLWGYSSGEDADYCFAMLYSQDNHNT
jgi:hypothetical protein